MRGAILRMVTVFLYFEICLLTTESLDEKMASSRCNGKIFSSITLFLTIFFHEE